jgi:ABC-type glycerol-3-phosphate transport system permease component
MNTTPNEPMILQRNAERERGQRLKQWLGTGVIWLFLSVIALVMLFPFLYMFFTSLKTTTDVQHVPPRLLPYSPITRAVNGEMLPIYLFEVDGQKREMVIDDTAGNIAIGYFTTAEQINFEEPEASAGLIAVPLDEARDLEREEPVGDDEFDVYEVTVEGETRDMLLAYRRGLKRFVAIDDPTVEAFAQKSIADSQNLAEEVEFQWENYRSVIELKNLGRALVNTTLVTFGVTFGQVVTSLLGGYAFSRIQFRGRNALFMVYLGTIMIPFVVLIIPLYQLMVIIGWQDKLASLILPWIFTAYGTFLMRQFFITIPKELEEAAALDGLSRLGTLWRVFVPLSGPAIATQTIITFLYAWNSFIWPLVIIGEGNTENHVVTLSLRQLATAAAAEPNLMLTGAAVAILPPLIMFLLAQKYFIEGIANTGLK